MARDTRFRVGHSCNLKDLLMVNKLVEGNSTLKTKIENALFKRFLELQAFDISNNLLECLLQRWDEKNCAFTKSNGECVPFSLVDVQDLLPFDDCNVEDTIELFEENSPKDYGAFIMTDYLKNHHSLKDAISLFENDLKSESPNTKILCRLYIIILWSSFLFPISSKGLHLNFLENWTS